uniref:SWIM-type domain-containing protein n=1 Tax=Knipowitschia caucasica TaxID=637954 RepID=A0AAV2MK29_KNICA
MSDYKEGKAFSYYKSGWVREMFYFRVPSSKYCFLKAECVPSEKIRQIPHQVYVIIEQDTGRIEGAYCTCFAGLGQTCNHVAALLFKVDDAWKRGITNQACTSLPCIWNKYGSTKDIAQPKRIQEMKWKKHHYKNTDDEKVENPTVRQLFTPHARKAAGATLQKLRDALAGACPQAVLFTSMETSNMSVTEGPRRDLNEKITPSEGVNTEVPSSLQQLARSVTDGCNQQVMV